MAARSRGRGFTFVELMVVVGILGLMASLAVFQVTRNRDQVQLARSVASLRAEVERARALARTAGSRLGTARVVYGPGCVTGLGGGLLWVSINPGTGNVILPQTIQYNAATDTLQLNCDLWDFGGARGAAGEAVFRFPTVVTTFGFSANGRLAFPDGVIGPPGIFVQLQHTGGTSGSPGFRVLPAGVTCIASNPAPLPTPCDQDFP